MFTGFEPANRDPVFERRRGVSYLLAVAIYLAAGGYGLFLHYEKGRQVDVLLEPEIKDFVSEEVDEPEPEIEEEEAPPPPPEAPPPKPKKRKKSPPKPAPKQPDAIPEGPPPEQEAARGDKAYGDGQGGTGSAKKPKAKPKPTKPKAKKPKPKAKPKAKQEKIDPTKPIDRPERSTPPKPSPSNKTPQYPKELRDQGIEGQIVIKLHISNDGSVKGMKILRKKTTATGEDGQKRASKLFLKAVVAAVKTWKYTPCKYQGQAISVWIPVTIPFKLKAG
ncbi:MAG TPA: energy transducer TonB [Nannocystis exedens]|nr:energy transducer TonB [Nannocystis exedens]